MSHKRFTWMVKHATCLGRTGRDACPRMSKKPAAVALKTQKSLNLGNNKILISQKRFIELWMHVHRAKDLQGLTPHNTIKRIYM